jgi:hypothetical protein
MNDGKLIRASDARKAILNIDPKYAYCIDSIPAVDAVEVVRCKDCKLFSFCYNDSEQKRHKEDFCSSGERRCDNG